MDRNGFSRMIRCRVPAAVHEALERASIERHQPVAVIVRDALREHLQRQGLLQGAAAPVADTDASESTR